MSMMFDENELIKKKKIVKDNKIQNSVYDNMYYLS